MAKLYPNDKGFLVVVMNHEEALDCHLGVIEDGRHIVIDNNTGELITDAIYYVCVLNMCFSKSSFIRWLAYTTKRHNKDILYEKRNFERVKNLIRIS